MKAKYKLKSLVLEKEDGTIETVDVNMENFEISMDYGIKIYNKPNSYTAEMESNGMRRMKILAASGCDDYDYFRTDAK